MSMRWYPSGWTAVLFAGSVATAMGPMDRVFPYQRADQGRQLARDECKPLALHFVPDSQLGGDQLIAFYQGPDRIPDAVLEKVVVVALPTGAYRDFARELGITGEGGYRAISPFDLDVIDQRSLRTMRSGFV